MIEFLLVAILVVLLLGRNLVFKILGTLVGGIALLVLFVVIAVAALVWFGEGSMTVRYLRSVDIAPAHSALPG